MGEANRRADATEREQARHRAGAVDVSGWSLALMGAITFLGDDCGDSTDHLHLRPAYQFARGPQPAPRGGFAIVNQVSPVLWCVSQPEVWIPLACCVLIPCSKLSAKEQSDIGAAVSQCDEMLSKMREQDRVNASGIEVVGPDALSRIMQGKH